MPDHHGVAARVPCARRARSDGGANASVTTEADGACAGAFGQRGSGVMVGRSSSITKHVATLGGIRRTRSAPRQRPRCRAAATATACSWRRPERTTPRGVSGVPGALRGDPANQGVTRNRYLRRPPQVWRWAALQRAPPTPGARSRRDAHAHRRISRLRAGHGHAPLHMGSVPARAVHWRVALQGGRHSNLSSFIVSPAATSGPARAELASLPIVAQ